MGEAVGPRVETMAYLAWRSATHGVLGAGDHTRWSGRVAHWRATKHLLTCSQSTGARAGDKFGCHLENRVVAATRVRGKTNLHSWSPEGRHSPSGDALKAGQPTNVEVVGVSAGVCGLHAQQDNGTRATRWTTFHSSMGLKPAHGRWHGARGSGLGTRGTGHGARGTGHGTRDTGHGARDTGQRRQGASPAPAHRVVVPRAQTGQVVQPQAVLGVNERPLTLICRVTLGRCR